MYKSVMSKFLALVTFSTERTSCLSFPFSLTRFSRIAGQGRRNKSRTTVYRLAATIESLTIGDPLSGLDVLPGFSLSVEQILADLTD